MPHWSKESTVYGLINVICICRIKLILIRGRLSTLGNFLSFPSNPSPIKWSLDDIHLARENKASYHSVCVQWEGILQGCLDSVWKRDVMQRIKTWGSLCQALGWAYNGPAVMLFGSGSQPNSKFQVNNNVWICRNQVQSLRGAQQAFCFAFWAAAKVFKHSVRGNSRGSPAVPLLHLNATHSTQGRKMQLMYPKQTWGWRSHSSVGGICVTLEGCWAEKDWVSKDPLRHCIVETTSSLSPAPFCAR